MEFRFNVNEVFKQPVVEINSSLIPPGLSLADKRALWDAVGKVSDVVNTMGEASAAAQNLTKPITTSERLRNSDHKLYLLIDQSANNGKGAVTGMLKTGKKGLYVFDRDSHHYQVQPSCVLDFYIHETKQRMGLGKKLFEYMLDKEQTEPVKMAIDRPSDKFLGFLNKHYSLNNPVRQMNNFVVYDGFFPERKDDSSENNNAATGKSNQPANGLQSNFTSPYGRYGAPRPPCSMGQIIHNQSPLAQQTQEPVGTSLNIRQPTKTRSLPFNNRQQQLNSGGNQATSQSMPNMPGTNQNFNNTQQQQNTQQQPGSDYYATAQQIQGAMTQNPQSMNAQPQGNYVQTQNPQPVNMQTQNNYVSPQNQQQLYQTQQPNSNQQYNVPQSPQYNETPYYQNQNQFNTQLRQNFIPQQQQPNQFYAQGNQLQGNAYQNMQPQTQQYIQMPSPQQQQYVSDKAQNIQPVQASPQTSDVQLQRKKSVQFIPTPQTMPQVNYNQHAQSGYDQRATQQVIHGQTVSGTHIALQQPATRASQTNMRPISANPQTSQPVAYQGQQSGQPILNQQQNMQYPQNPVQSVQSQIYPQQSQQATYHSQQPQQTMSQQQYAQPVYKNEQPQPMYQAQVQQAPQQYPTSPAQSAQQIQQHYEANNVQGRTMTVDANRSVPNMPVSQNNYPYQPSNDINQGQAVHQQNQQAYLTGQQQNATMQSNMYRQNQNVQNPMNYQTPQPPIVNQQQPMSVPNMSNYQPPIQNIQYSQPDIPQQMYSQVPQQVDPSTIMPPVEATQLNKNYQYFDSNTGNMQNAVGENAKHTQGAEQMMAPNASG